MELLSVIVKTNHWLKHGNFIEASTNGRLIGQSHETLTQKISKKFHNILHIMLEYITYARIFFKNHFISF